MVILTYKSLCIPLAVMLAIIFVTYIKVSLVTSIATDYVGENQVQFETHDLLSNTFVSAIAAVDDDDSHDTHSTSFVTSTPTDYVDEISNVKQLWLIRHGERMDEVKTITSQHWAKYTARNRLFDPPLTHNGLQQAEERGYLLLQYLSKYKMDKTYYPKYVYSSPTQRTIATAMKIAQILKLPIKVIPGLSSCASAVSRGGLRRENIDKNDGHHHWELYLQRCGFMHRTYLYHCKFLTKHEIVKKFAQNGTKILFDYTEPFMHRFANTVQTLVNSSDTNIILAVTHREGIMYLDDILSYSRIPYCKLAKYAFVGNTGTQIYKNAFKYFEDDENKEVSMQTFHSPFTYTIRNDLVVTDTYLKTENMKLKAEIMELRDKLLRLENI